MQQIQLAHTAFRVTCQSGTHVWKRQISHTAFRVTCQSSSHVWKRQMAHTLGHVPTTTTILPINYLLNQIIVSLNLFVASKVLFASKVLKYNYTEASLYQRPRIEEIGLPLVAKYPRPRIEEIGLA